jgi:hypothetical protein
VLSSLGGVEVGHPHLLRASASTIQLKLRCQHGLPNTTTRGFRKKWKGADGTYGAVYFFRVLMLRFVIYLPHAGQHDICVLRVSGARGGRLRAVAFLSGQGARAN